MEFLQQTKLSKSEWNSLEVPFTKHETEILKLIRDGYGEPNILYNNSTNMMLFTKLPISEEMHYYIFIKYFQSIIDPLKSKYNVNTFTTNKTIKRLKSADSIRVQNVDQIIQNNMENIYEFVCLQYCKIILKNLAKKINYDIFLYTLIQWTKAHIKHNNPYVMDFINGVIEIGINNTSIKSIIVNASNIFEKNTVLHNFDNMTLYSHQKEIYSFCESFKNKPKLILYTAPTGTGKTLTPLGLSQGYKIIFVCVARHIGLSLAKSAINIDKKIAFAFGCETASDIRLHYFAAIDYDKNKKSGGIGKVDNSNGAAVDIMICDVQSYLVAMYYMLSFNAAENIIMYWDEPTITLDYQTHPLHSVIHNNWKKNKIPNVILSCATLPREDTINETLQDFRCHFPDSLIHTITSFDCKKSIPIVQSDGKCYLPHFRFKLFHELKKCAEYCMENKTLLRYFDLDEIIHFIIQFHTELDPNNPVHMINYFDTIKDISMHTLKLYYLDILLRMDEEHWNRISNVFSITQKKKYKIDTSAEKNSNFHRIQSLPNQDNNDYNMNLLRSSSEPSVSQFKQQIKNSLDGVLLTTVDACTLTDGPTIYLADNLLNLAKFYTKQSNIPEFILKQLIHNIETNDKIKSAIEEMENNLALKLQTKNNSNTQEQTTSSKKKQTKNTNEKAMDENAFALKENIDSLKKQIHYLSLQPEYMPNRPEHQEKWNPQKVYNKNAFTSNIDEKTVKEIMNLDIHNDYKLLVLMGIGVLIENHNKSYEEIVKRLAQEQKLYLILASSDFIYGTNYQFCHGFIGKDLPSMTQQKILQSMGRIGRNSTQHDYSIRFRADDMIDKLFQEPEHNIEATNMNVLLSHD